MVSTLLSKCHNLVYQLSKKNRTFPIYHNYLHLCFTLVISARSRDYTFPVSAWKQHGNNPPPLLPPPRLTSRQRLFAWSVFWLQLQLARRRSLSEEESEGSDVLKIRGEGGGSCLAHQRRSRKKRPESEDKVPDTKSRGEKSRGASALVSENGATRRGRARLCGGEHREEAQQKGLSQERWRAFLMHMQRRIISLWFFLHLLYVSGFHWIISKMTVQCIAHFAA